MGTVIYAGTSRGVLAIKEQNGDWTVGERRFMPEWEITQLLVRGKDQLVSGTRGDGVWLQTDKSGEGRTGGWVKPCYGRPGPGKTHCIAVDPADPDTIYAGTEPIGLWVTHDGGRNWEPLPGLWNIPDVADITYPVPSVEPHVRRITIDPADRDVLYVALQVGYLAKSTDRGVTWRLLTGGIDADVHSILVRPDNPDRIYAATGGHGHRQGVTAGKALYASDDGGETWSPMATEFAQDYSLPMVMHPANPDVLFSSVANGPPPAWRRPSGAEARFITSKDGGRSWREVALPDDGVGKAFPGAIAFDSANPDDAYMSTDRGALYRSRDAGESWKRVPVDLAKAGGLTEIGLSDMKIFHV